MVGNVYHDLGLHPFDPVVTQVSMATDLAPHELNIGVRYQLRRVVHAPNGHHAVDALRELEAGRHYGECSSANALCDVVFRLAGLRRPLVQIEGDATPVGVLKRAGASRNGGRSTTATGYEP
jgi:hypothetical protein